MKFNLLKVGLRVTHPHHGEGTVERLVGSAAEIRFGNTLRTVDPELADLSVPEPTVKLGDADIPLGKFVRSVLQDTIAELGLESPHQTIEQLGPRWHKGRLVLHPADPTLQTKELPLEQFFHKIVGLRNQLRVLEQKINAHPTLSDGDKVEMQQYISRCYGALTTFNLLFKNKEDQFSSK